MSRPHAIPLLLAALLILPLPGVAQKAPPVEEPSLFGETIDVRVVNVEVVVTDRDGNRVKDLKPGDFRLKVDGKEVPISFFTEVREGVSAAPAAGQTQPAGPVDPGSEVGTSYLVFIDDYFSTDIRRNEVLQSLKSEASRLGPQDRMAIVAWDGGRLAMISNWAGSPSQLARAFDTAMQRPTHGLTRLTEHRSFRSDVGFSDQTLADNRPLDLSVTYRGLSEQETAYGSTLSRQIEGAVTAVVSTMRAFASPPGRKVMLLLSGGWPFSIQSFVRPGANVAPSHQVREGEDLLRPLTSTANLLGYTVYPVDVPGQQTLSSDAADASAGGNNTLQEQEIEGTLEFLAQETGGQPIRNGNRTVALAQASADTRSYYWLGFTPTWERNDKRHKMDVDVLRPGLKARSRTGFLDLSKKAEVSMQLESALLFGNLPGAAPMPLKVGAPAPQKRKKTLEIPIILGLPVDILTIVPVDGKFAAQAELRIAASSKEGNTSDIPVIPLHLKSDKAPKPGGFIRYDTTVTVQGDANHLVIALYDPVSGKIATAETDITRP
jgi:VWFA-related protein